ncbi:tyrosine-type recombinase/integrase [bacterium]|nr:tyrosine-type recombinase/integrase [candidate division CSSED10-310 bacterium]
MTDRQIKAVLDVVSQRITLKENHPTGRKSDLRPRRDFAIIMLLLNGGLRRSEICDLDLDHLQGKKLINVKCKGNFFRNITLGKETVRVIEEYGDRTRS